MKDNYFPLHPSGKILIIMNKKQQKEFENGNEKLQLIAREVLTALDTVASATEASDENREDLVSAKWLVNNLKLTKGISKKDFLKIVYYLIVLSHGKIDDELTEKIISLFNYREFGSDALRKWYLMLISASLRQKQVLIKEYIADFIIILFRNGYVEWSILITMLEGEYISTKVFRILNQEEVQKILVKAGMGKMIIATVQRIIKDGGNRCIWTRNFNETSDVKKQQLESLLETYKRLETEMLIAATPRMMLEEMAIAQGGGE